MLNAQFGTHRGLVRLALSYAQVGLKRAHIIPPKPENVARLVFVCHGNICRSAFADHYARQLGMNSASFGLSTSSNKGAFPHAAEISAQKGVDLSEHNTTAVEDFAPQAGDFLLAMEVRHLSKMAAMPALGEYPRSLLGLYSAPPFPHLHDPYKLEPRYMPVCLDRIKSAVETLKLTFPGAATAR